MQDQKESDAAANMRAERDAALAELADARAVIDAARVLLGSLPGTSDKDELVWRSALTNALNALDAKIGELK